MECDESNWMMEVNPSAFMTLIGKVLPLQVSGAPGGDAIVLKIVKYDGAS